MSRLRALPWVTGVVLLACTLVGANRLLHPDDGTSPGGAAAPPKNGKPNGPPLTGGTIALGTVDSAPSPVRVGPPSVSAIATVAKVFVSDGVEVKPGDPLVQFDDGIFQAELKQAKAGLTVAVAAKTKAEAGKTVHLKQVEAQKHAVKAANDDLKSAEDASTKGKEAFEKVLNALRNLNTNQPLTEAEKQLRRTTEPELLAAEAVLTALRNRVEGEQKKLAILEAAPVDADVATAEAEIERTKTLIEKAEAAVNACLIKARDVGGVVEKVNVGPGTTIGPGTREPLMILVPAGRRIVRAEVDAEFAFKWAGRQGQRAVVTDANNFTLTYDGTVTRIGTAFLPKRSALETLTVNPVYVLECEIEVTDPAPAGKPPLRVGQPVRVTIP